MANVFLRSTDGSDADNGTTWALAKATLLGAIGVMNPGDTLFVADAHAESTAGNATYTIPGTAALPSRILCVDDSGDPVNPTTLATTATITRTGNPGSPAINGFFYCYGVTFVSGSGGANTTQNIGLGSADPSSHFMRFEQCGFTAASTTGNSRIRFGYAGLANGGDCAIELIDCTFTVGATTAALQPGLGRVLVRGGSLGGATVPETLVIPTVAFSGGGLFRVIGMDLSLATGALVAIGSTHSGIIRFEQCKLGVGVARTTGTMVGQGAPLVSFDNCDTGDTNYTMLRVSYAGTVQHETTLVRTGGASDGTTPLAWRMTANANAKHTAPLESPEMVVWNDVTGSAKTVTVEILHDGVTALTNKEVWLEVEYLGTSGFPISTTAHDGTSVLTTGVNQTASSATWTTTGLTNPHTQKLDVTITPEEKGLIRCKVMFGRSSLPNYDVYVDPKLTVA